LDKSNWVWRLDTILRRKEEAFESRFESRVEPKIHRFFAFAYPITFILLGIMGILSSDWCPLGICSLILGGFLAYQFYKLSKRKVE